MHEDFVKYGRILFEQGLNNSHSGNLSKREGKWIYVTRHGARLGDLTPKDIVKVNLENETCDKVASLEVKVHRAIYRSCPHLHAIAHAHPPYGVVLSLKKKQVVPIDDEGRYYLPLIPVLCCNKTIGSDEVAAGLPRLLSRHKAAIVRGHGAFAGAQTLEEATMLVSVLESASRIIALDTLLK